MENERHRHGLSQKALLLAILKEIEELAKRVKPLEEMARRVKRLEEVANAARPYLEMVHISELE